MAALADFHLAEATTVVAAEHDDRVGCQQVARHASAGAARAVRRALERTPPDVVHVEGFYLVQHLPTDLDVPVLLVDQNVEAALWRQRAEVAGSAADRWRAACEAARCEAAEIKAWRRADRCAFVTEQDARLAASLCPGLDPAVVPDGVDHLVAASPPEPITTDRPTVCFVGNFAYEPNHDAARFLLDEVLPRLRSAVPDVDLLLVGNAPPPWLQELAASRGATVTGRVPSVAPYLLGADVVVCPLRVGGGVKVKVLEALSVGCAVVTTPVGAQGITPAGGAPLVVEPTGAAVAGATAQLLRDPRRRIRLRTAGRSLAATLPTWDDAAASLVGLYGQLARDARPVAVSQ